MKISDKGTEDPARHGDREAYIYTSPDTTRLGGWDELRSDTT